MDVNRIIKIEELEVGDEFITCSGNTLKYHKVLRKPKLTHKITKYSQGQLVERWSGTRCSTNLQEREEMTNKGTRWERIYTYKKYTCTPENHNVTENVYGLAYKQMWLVKRDI